MTCNSPTCQTAQTPAFLSSDRQSSQPFGWTDRLVRVWRLLNQWYDRCQQRYDLAEFDDRLLDDISLRREDVDR